MNDVTLDFQHILADDQSSALVAIFINEIVTKIEAYTFTCSYNDICNNSLRFDISKIYCDP